MEKGERIRDDVRVEERPLNGSDTPNLQKITPQVGQTGDIEHIWVEISARTDLKQAQIRQSPTLIQIKAFLVHHCSGRVHDVIQWKQIDFSCSFKPQLQVHPTKCCSLELWATGPLFTSPQGIDLVETPCSTPRRVFVAQRGV